MSACEDSGCFDKNKTRNDVQSTNMYCKLHPLDKVTLYCYPCKAPICIECLRYEHRSLEHHYESIYKTETRLNEKLIDLYNKMNDLERNQPQDDQTINEIDFQYHQVEEKINETYQAFEILLKKHRDRSLTELKELRELRKTEVREAYSKINECLQEVEDKVQQCETQISRNENMLNHIAAKETLLQELINCTNQMKKLNDKLHVDFNEFKEKSFLEMMDKFNERIEAKMFQRIYHSSNPFVVKLTVNGHQTHILSSVDEDTDIDLNFSQLLSTQSLDSSTSSQEQTEKEIEVTEVEKKSNISVKKNNSAGGDACGHEPKKYVLAENFDYHKFIPQKLRLKNRFCDKFIRPQDFCLNANGDIIVADTGNHRIGIYDQNGNCKLRFGSKGSHKGLLVYPKYLSTFINNNSKNYGNIVVYDKLDSDSRETQICRIQIFTEVGVFLQIAHFKSIDVLKALKTTMDDRIVTLDIKKKIFIISDTLFILNQIDCYQLLITPLNLAVKGNEIFITDSDKYFITVINDNGQFLGRIGHENQNFSPQGLCLVDNKIIFNHSIPYSRTVKFYEYENGSCNLKYEVKDVQVLPSPDKFNITKDGLLVLLNRIRSYPEILIFSQ